MSEETQTTDTQQQAEKSLEEALSKIDLAKVTTAEIFQDIIHQTKLHSMRMMVAVALLEKKIASESEAAEQNEKQEPANPELTVVEDQA